LHALSQPYRKHIAARRVQYGVLGKVYQDAETVTHAAAEDDQIDRLVLGISVSPMGSVGTNSTTCRITIAAFECAAISRPATAICSLASDRSNNTKIFL
jgi:hypothetical protein